MLECLETHFISFIITEFHVSNATTYLGEYSDEFIMSTCLLPDWAFLNLTSNEVGKSDLNFRRELVLCYL